MSASLSLLVAARDQVNIFTPDQLNESWISQLFQGMKRHCSEITMERLSYAFVVFNGGVGGGDASESASRLVSSKALDRILPAFSPLHPM